MPYCVEQKAAAVLAHIGEYKSLDWLNRRQPTCSNTLTWLCSQILSRGQSEKFTTPETLQHTWPPTITHTWEAAYLGVMLGLPRCQIVCAQCLIFSLLGLSLRFRPCLTPDLLCAFLPRITDHLFGSSIVSVSPLSAPLPASYATWRRLALCITPIQDFPLWITVSVIPRDSLRRFILAW